MHTFLKLTLPYPADDLHEIERRLVECRGIIHFDHGFPQYSMAAYQCAIAANGHRYYAVFDLNVFSALLAIAKGRAANDSMRNVAALMAFLISFDCIIDPRMSALEYSSVNGLDKTKENIRLFRKADNVDPAIYADIACCRRDSVSRQDLPDVADSSADSFQTDIAPPYWQHYAALLKLGVILNSAGEPLDKLERFMKWQRDEFFFSACTTIFAVQSLGPQPIKDPLKQKDSRYSSAPLKGVLNAAWDMSIVQFWADRVEDDDGKDRHWLLCSFDVSLQELARFLLVPPFVESGLQRRAIVESYWPKRLIDAAISHMAIADTVLDGQNRLARIASVKNTLPELIPSLESEFLHGRSHFAPVG